MTTNRILFVLFVLCVLSTVSAFGAASNVYITQSGSPTGNCTTGVQTPAFFNNATSWGSGPSQIGPNTVVLFCGTFTGTAGQVGFTFQGSGVSGSPVTLKFDTGAVMTAPYWGSGSTGAVTCNGHSYVTVDGGTNGLITNTANGTVLANRQSSSGIYFSHRPNSEIKNLSITNIYLNQGSSSSATDIGGASTWDIYLQGTSTNTSIHNNVLSSARGGVMVSFDSGGDASGVRIYNNTINDHPWSISIGADNAASTANGVSIYGNNISDWSNWQFPSSSYHTDGIIVYNDVTTGPIGTYSIYNNTFTGSLGGGSPTGYIACGETSSCTIFNNLMVDNGRYLCDGYLWMYQSGGPDYIYNNTLIGSTTAGTAVTLNGSPLTIKNNIFLNVNYGLNDYSTTLSEFESDIVSSNNNVWQTVSGGAPTMTYNAGGEPGFLSFSTWQGIGYDVNSTTSNPLLSASYSPQAGSAAIARGANLTALGITSLNSDIMGNFRGTGKTCASGDGTCWDAGAYVYGPAAPTGISVTSAQ